MFRKTASIFASAIVACGAFVVNAAGFDGMALTTNDWFDASFTSLAVDTVIATNTATGITLGAGSWTSAPTNGTAKIVADEDFGGGATMLAVDAPGEELTFTPAALASATGMETLAFDVCTEAADELPAQDAQTQTAFTIYSDDGVTHALKGYVDGGWTNLEYAAGADTLTNAWFTLYLDFATVSSVRYVRFSVKPAAAASATVLTDSEGTAWFPAAVPAATTVNTVSFVGVGSCRTFSGDSLEEAAVGAASYNGVSYATLSEAIAAAVADSWANGNVTLLADVEWSPTAAGTYDIDVNGHVLTVNGAIYDISGTEYTVSGFKYYWIGSTALGGDGTSWNDAKNWSTNPELTAAATAVPGSNDAAIFNSESTVALSALTTVSNVTLNADVTLTGARLAMHLSNGSGKWKLGVGAGFQNNGSDAMLSNDVYLVGADTSVTNLFYCNGAGWTFAGELTGKATFQVEVSIKNIGLISTGSWSDFAGCIYFKPGPQGRNSSIIKGDNRGSEKAVCDINVGYSKNAFLDTSSTIYKFGSLNGSIGYDKHGSSGNIYEIGHLGKETTLAGYFSNIDNSGGENIRLVGGVLHSSAYRLKSYQIAGGLLDITTTNVFRTTSFSVIFTNDVAQSWAGGVLRLTYAEGNHDISTNIVNSTAPIRFDSNGSNYEWAAQLASSNTGGLEKLGEGTLVLKETPAYTGDTYLDGGTLKIPTSAGVTVKTHVEGMTVRRDTTTEEGYTVYTLDKKHPMMILVF